MAIEMIITEEALNPHLFTKATTIAPENNRSKSKP
jgi:hypothetical protein